VLEKSYCTENNKFITKDILKVARHYDYLQITQITKYLQRLFKWPYMALKLEMTKLS
jgi:hypothetical protein